MNSNKCNVLDTHLNKSSLSENSHVSNYALKVALHTMKERCQKLQNRLSCLEEENLQLRIERHSIPGVIKKEREGHFDTISLHKKIEELNRQKSQLSHHIFMVATENKELWERLSKLSDDKNLETHSKNLLGSSNKHVNVVPDKSIQILELCKVDTKEESLEEISLKVLNSIRKARPSLEGSECDDAIEWQTNALNVKECEFNIKRVEGQSELDGIIHLEIKDILDKLNLEKAMLKQQQQELKSALELILRISKEKKSGTCKTCVRNTEETSSKPLTAPPEVLENETVDLDEKDNTELEMKFSAGFHLKNKENAFEDRICPLCTKFYAKSTPFDEFNDHVLSHFVEDSEQDSHMSLFEITA